MIYIILFGDSVDSLCTTKQSPMRQHLALLAAALVLPSCRKEESASPAAPPLPPSTSTALVLEHHVDGAQLAFDTISYVNEAGHAFSVTRLEYYVSEIILRGADCCGTPDHVIPGPFYINGTMSNRFELGTLPAGEYTGATLLLGLPASLNVTGALPNTMSNVNMAWPDMMGGGYHFMKFEGHFLNGTTPTGYAMHIGRNENLPVCDMPQSFALHGQAGTLTLRFNLNEVFRDPHTYDLPSGSYSMGSMMLMGLLKDNCANAFTISHQPA